MNSCIQWKNYKAIHIDNSLERFRTAYETFYDVRNLYDKLSTINKSDICELSTGHTNQKNNINDLDRAIQDLELVLIYSVAFVNYIYMYEPYKKIAIIKDINSQNKTYNYYKNEIVKHLNNFDININKVH